jgi:hypothetical protein
LTSRETLSFGTSSPPLLQASLHLPALTNHCGRAFTCSTSSWPGREGTVLGGLPEAPAGRAVRLGGRDPECGLQRQAVELPRWRPGARGAERGRERVPSTSAGHPPSRYRPASRSSVFVSVTLVASPSSTRSIPSSLTEIVHAGLAARLRALRVLAPFVKYSSPSSRSAPTPAAWGRPSGREVPRKNVISGPDGASARASRALLHGSSGSP